MNIYESCPTIQDEKFIIRLTSRDDTEDLFKVYSDEKAVLFFNSDNCDGDDFHYKTLERMKQATEFWLEAYAKGWFVRWSIVDKTTNEAIGTLEAFNRSSDDVYNGYGLIRLDLRSDYETKEAILDLLKLIVPNTYRYFDCEQCMTKAIPEATERIMALQEYGFKKSDIPMIGGNDRKEYLNYWVIG